MTAGRGELEDDPENEGGEEHGQCTGEVNAVEGCGGEGEVATHEVDKKILGKQIKENGDTCEQGGNVPFPFAEEGLDPLHQKAHHGIEDDAVSKAQGIDGVCINLRITTLGAERVLGIPEESADECKKEHGGKIHTDGGAEKDQWQDQHTGAMQSRDRGHKLLNHAGCKGQ